MWVVQNISDEILTPYAHVRTPARSITTRRDISMQGVRIRADRRKDKILTPYTRVCAPARSIITRCAHGKLSFMVRIGARDRVVES